MDMKSIFPLWPHDLGEKKPSQYDFSVYLPRIAFIRTIKHCLAHVSMLDDGSMSEEVRHTTVVQHAHVS